MVLLARAAAESGQAAVFDAVVSRCVRALKTAQGHDVVLATAGALAPHETHPGPTSASEDHLE